MNLNSKDEIRSFIFCTNGPIDRGTSGGAVRELHLMKRIGSNQRFVLSVIASKEICKRFRNNNIHANYIVVPSFIDPSGATTNLLGSFLRSIYSLIRPLPIYSEKIVLHSPSDFLWDTIPSAFKRLKNRDIVWFATVYHIIPPPSKRPGGISPSNLISFAAQRFSLSLIARWADIVQTETNYVKDKLTQTFRVSSHKVVVCESGINPIVIKINNDSSIKRYDACFLARLHKSKGIFDAISAWALVVKQRKDAQLAIAGSGSEKVVDEVKSLIMRLRLQKNVVYLGYLSEQKKCELFLNSKLYLLPSYEEGIPIAFYEAMFFGLPVVTYYLPTYRDISDNIIHAKIRDVDGLSKRMLLLLENHDLYKKYALRGQNYAKTHTWDAVADTLALAIEEVLKNKKANLNPKI